MFLSAKNTEGDQTRFFSFEIEFRENRTIERGFKYGSRVYKVLLVISMSLKVFGIIFGNDFPRDREAYPEVLAGTSGHQSLFSPRDREGYPEVLAGTSGHRSLARFFLPGTFARNLLAGFKFNLVSNGQMTSPNRYIYGFRPQVTLWPFHFSSFMFQGFLATPKLPLLPPLKSRAYLVRLRDQIRVQECFGDGLKIRFD